MLLAKLIVFHFLLLICNSMSIFGEEKCETALYPPKDEFKVETYQINLDDAPIDRWKHIVSLKKVELRNIFTVFKKFILNFGPIARIIIDFVDKDLDKLTSTMPFGYGDEMRGMSEAADIPLGEVVMFNIFYELFSACTSIVSDSEDGRIYHGRNLDFGLFMGWKNHSWTITDALRPLIVNLDFVRDGHVVYKTVSYVGYVGIFTGLKQNAFTITLNERFAMEGGFVGLLQWIGGKKELNWSSFLIRQILEHTDTFEEAVKQLEDKPLLAPTYFIVGGNRTGQAAVITRSLRKNINTWKMGTGNSDWYILETNYDHWKKPLFLDDRRTPARRCLDKSGKKNMGFSSMYNILSSKPVRNKLTTYTALMQVNSGKIETYIQHCPDPCSPW